MNCRVKRHLTTTSPHSNQVNIAPNKQLAVANDHDELVFAFSENNAMTFIWGQHPYVPAASRQHGRPAEAKPDSTIHQHKLSF